MSENKKSRALVPVNDRPTPSVIKRNLRNTPFSIVDKEIHLQNKKDVRKILPDILGRVLARVWIDNEFKDAFKADPQLTLENHGIYLPEDMHLEFHKPNTDRPQIVVYEKKPNIKFKIRVMHLQMIMIAGR